MVRKYKNKKPPVVDKAGKLKMATDLTNRGSSIRQAAKDVGISEVVLRRHLKADKAGSTLASPGMRTALSESCERELNLVLSETSKWGFALSRTEVKGMVRDFVKKARGMDTPEGRHIAKYCKFTVSE